MKQANYIITIGRQFGSGGREVGKRVAELLQINYYDKELLQVAAKESGLSDTFLKEYDEKPTRSFLYSLVVNPQGGTTSLNGGKTVEDIAYEAQRDALLHVADQGPCVIIGRGADTILKRNYPIVSVFISGDHDFRVKRVMERDLVTEEQAEKKIARVDRARASFYNGYSDSRWGEAATYDICLRQSSSVDAEWMAHVIVDYVKNRFLL